MMASISHPRMASPTLCAHGRSGARQVLRWRTAPVGFLFWLALASGPP